MARCVWALEGEETTEMLQNVKAPDARSWLAEMLCALSHVQRTRVVVTLWAIWHARRKAIHEAIFQSPLSIKGFVDRYIEDLGIVQQQQPKIQRQPTKGITISRWIAPPEGLMKINVDASVSKNLKIASVAAITCSTVGNFLGASALVIKGISDPETLEVMACREGLALASDLGLQRFRLASDCTNAVRSIQGGSLDSYGNVIKEIRDTMKLFGQVEVVREGRTSNGDADRLAKSSIYSQLGRYVWFFDPPEGVCTSYFE
jgi:ribonuclease HI